MASLHLAWWHDDDPQRGGGEWWQMLLGEALFPLFRPLTVVTLLLSQHCQERDIGLVGCLPRLRSWSLWQAMMVLHHIVHLIAQEAGHRFSTRDCA